MTGIIAFLFCSSSASLWLSRCKQEKKRTIQTEAGFEIRKIHLTTACSLVYIIACV